MIENKIWPEDQHMQNGIVCAWVCAFLSFSIIILSYFSADPCLPLSLFTGGISWGWSLAFYLDAVLPGGLNPDSPKEDSSHD